MLPRNQGFETEPTLPALAPQCLDWGEPSEPQRSSPTLIGVCENAAPQATASGPQYIARDPSFPMVVQDDKQKNLQAPSRTTCVVLGEAKDLKLPTL